MIGVLYALKYAEGWDRHFAEFDNSLKLRILKKLEQMKGKEESRHLQHGLPYFVEEVGGCRITFKKDEETKTKEIYFIGDHKQYERWCHEKSE